MANYIIKMYGKTIAQADSLTEAKTIAEREWPTIANSDVAKIYIYYMGKQEAAYNQQWGWS